MNLMATGAVTVHNDLMVKRRFQPISG
jgi:hypothetical protein